MASCNHQRPPAYFQEDLPSRQGKTSLQSWTLGYKKQKWGIYGIIYHYAPFSSEIQWQYFQDSMSSFHIMSPVHHSISKEGLSYSSLQSMEVSRRPFKDTNHLVLQVLAFSTHQGRFQEVLNFQISFQGIKSSSAPLTTQLAQTGFIQETCM
ncbi:hypothetical protein O181_005513 [Austropuccinia psidii MF-1]|uniref:Uncharacterized protein n=1 Tax=Austropuccinia psidii MF-1 TaxID=1389203 RepID=A0A9Q3BIE2_9BASI|nr:hypothetical protein [Austropuccinia psidii MF-1]